MKHPFVSRACYWAVDILSRSLERDEREAVCGDFVESGQTGVGAVRDILGLVVRRQTAIWKHWQPWLALLGVAVGASALLRVLGWFGTAFFSWLVGFGNFRTPTEDIIHLASLSVALFAWSWMNGFTIGSVSGRTVWLTDALLWLFVVSSFWLLLRSTGMEHHPPAPADVLVPMLFVNIAGKAVTVVPAIWGLRQGRRRRLLKLQTTITLTVFTMILTVLVTWTTGFYENTRAAMSYGSYLGVPWYVRLQPLVVLSWPTVYMILTAKPDRAMNRGFQ